MMSYHRARSKRVNETLKTHMVGVPNEDIEGKQGQFGAVEQQRESDPKVSVEGPVTYEGREMVWTDVKSDKRQA